MRERELPPVTPERIFERFPPARVTPSTSGSGLGLWIARALVEACGGRVRAFSDTGRGATLRIDLPVRTPPPDEDTDE